MPLKLSLAKGEKFIVNGAVIRNDGDHTDLVFENQSYILRQKDILTTETAATPASRIYFALQCAYLFPEKAENYLDTFTELLNDYLEAAPSAQVIEFITRPVRMMLGNIVAVGPNDKNNSDDDEQEKS